MPTATATPTAPGQNWSRGQEEGRQKADSNHNRQKFGAGVKEKSVSNKSHVAHISHIYHISQIGDPQAAKIDK